MQQENLDTLYQQIKDSINNYPYQLKQSWEEVSALELPEEFRSIRNIVFCGMGGSALGARIVKALTKETLSIPIDIYTEYNLPSYANEDSLVISSSYSGNTEETITTAKEAIEKKTNFFAITTGGKLGQLVQEKGLPAYVFDPKNNPSGQPRMAIGYASGALLSLLTKAGLLEIQGGEIESAVNTMVNSASKYGQEGEENEAIKLANTLHNKIPILVASEHLLGAAHTIKNQFNESAKTFSALFDLPELNHHLMEGLANPQSNRQVLHFIFLESNLYFPRVGKRYPLTKEVVEKNGISYSSFTPVSEDKLSQIYEVLIFGSYLVYYLTKNYSLNPIEIPWVDYFKEKLSQGQ